MAQHRKAWIEAGISLAEDPTLELPCPQCKQGNLEVLDVPLPGNAGIERYLSCPVCGARNILLIRRSPPQGEP